MVKTKLNRNDCDNIRWLAMWQAYMDFMEQNKRRPSKYFSEDKSLYNWCKHSRKLMNKGMMQQERRKLFQILMDRASNFRRLNQYSYACGAGNSNSGADVEAQSHEAKNEMMKMRKRVNTMYKDNLKVVAPTLFPDME